MSPVEENAPVVEQAETTQPIEQPELSNGLSNAEQLSKEKQAPAPIPVEKRGKEERAAYHLVPIERTMEDLHDGALEPDEIVGLIDARIKEAENDVKAVEKKKPVIGADKNAYVAAKQQWQADMEAAKAKLDYYNQLKAINAEATRSEMREAVEAVEPQVLIEQTPDEFVANQLGGFIKITPESFQKETGLKAEQKQMVGVIAGKDKGGVTVEQAAEIILENYGDELRGLGFNGDMQDMRDMIINILSNGNPRSYAKKGAEMRAQESVEQQMSQLEGIAIGMGFKDTQEMIEYEEAVVPRIIQDYTGFDETEYFNNLAENIEYDTTRESEGTRGSSELLQGEQSADNAGTGNIAEPGQGGEIQSDVYSGGENAAPQGNQQVSSSEIPNNQNRDNVSPVEGAAEGGSAPGLSGVQQNESGKMYSPEELAEAKEQLGELNATSAPEFAARLFSIKPWKTLEEANAALKELLASYGKTLNGQSLAVMPFLDKAQGLIREYNISQEPRSVEEVLENGDKRITNYNSRGEVETVATERNGKVVSVDNYDEGVLFETTTYDENGVATSVTRYDKSGNVVSTQVFENSGVEAPKAVDDAPADVADEVAKQEDKEVSIATEDELDVYLAEMKAAQERQKAFAQKSPRPSSFVEAYTANDAELIKRLDKQFNDALQTLVPLDIPAIEATIKSMKDRKSINKANSANDAYKALDHIEKALAKRKKQLEKELTEDDKRRLDIIKRGNRGELQETTQLKQENKPVESEPINEAESVNAYNVIKSEDEKKALRDRIQKWAKKLGVKINVLESYDEVTDEQAKVAILEQRVPGWFAGGEVYIYLPHVKNGVDLDKTVVHEVVAHKGIKQLLGKEFNKFLDHVWEMMSVPARAKFLSYVGAGKNATQADRRAAADEYVAALAEKVYKKQGMTAEEKTIWQKIADWFRQAFNVDEAKAEVLSKETLTDEDIAKMVRASYETLQSNKVDNEVASVDGGRAMFSKKEWGEIEEANKNFNEELDAFKEKKHNTLLHLGTPKRILSAAGVNAKELTLSPKVLNRKMEQHDLTTDDLKDLAMAIQSPILVYKHGENVPNIVVVTELNVKGGKLSIAIKLDENGNVVEINNVSSVHSKDAQTEIERLAKMGDEGLKDGLKWVEKEKVLDWFGIADLNSPIHTNNPELISIANIINNFENPSIESEKSSAEEENKTYFRKANENQEIFVSNARKAVGEIKQEKATPQQWLAMIKKNGGLKAGEDKWMGLSEWLENNESKSLTKQEVLDFVNENAIKIEEVEYEANPNSFEALKEEYEDLVRNEGFDAAQDVMLERFGDIFSIAFDDLGGELVIANKDAAATLLGSGNIINSTRLDYTTEGLENKREIALVVPTVEPYNQHDEIHFGDAGEGRAVAWVRFGETTDSEGNRVLVIDEIQSKRHQDGREKGYKSQADRTPATMDELSFGEYNGMTTVSLRGERFFFKSSTSKNEILDIINERIAAGQLGSANGLVPDAPFEKNWQELAMKRMLRLAAEEGFDKVAWTTGEQQAERYNIGSVVEYIDVSPYKAPGSQTAEWTDVRINAGVSSMDLRVDVDGNVVSGGNRTTNMAGEKLADVVGKELADKILSTKEDTILDGESLRIGGEGMKGFYDKMLPSFVSKYAKKWGAKVGTVEMPSLEQNNVMHSVDVTPEMRESVMEGQTMFSKRMPDKDAPIKEHTRTWAERCQEENPKLWNEVVEAMKLSPVWDMVQGDEDSRAAEVLQRLSDSRVNDLAQKEIDKARGVIEKAEAVSRWYRIKNAISDFWNWVQRNVFGTEPKNWEDFVDEVVGDFEGKTKAQRLKQRVGGLTRDILNAVFEKAGIDINLAEPAEVEQVAVSLSSVGEPTAPLGQRSSAESGERKGESQAVEGENQVESGSLSSVDESTAPLQARNRNMDREAWKKTFKKGGEKAYDLMYELHGGIVSAYPQEFLAYLKEVIGVADDVANIIEGAHDYLIADFKKKNPDLFKRNESEKVEDVHSLLATKGYSLLEHTMDNGKAIGVKMMYRDKFVPSGKTDASYTPGIEQHGRTVICYYNHPEARLQNQYVFTVTKDNAMETPTAYELVADPSLMTPEWAEYLEKIGRKNADGTFFLDGLVPNFNDPFSLSHLMIRVNKNSHDVETISRYNHGAFNERGEYERIVGQPNATLGNDLDKLVEGLNESLMEYKQLESIGGVPLGENMVVANDGKIYRYNDIKGGVHVGDGFWVDRRGDAHVINPGKEKLVGEFLYGGGKVKNVANGESVDIHGLKFTENGVEFYTGGEEVTETREIEIKGEKKTVTKKVIKGDAKNVITFDGDKTRLETESADSETIGSVGKLYDAYSIKGDNLKEAKSGFLEDFFWVRRIDFPNLEKAGDNCFNAVLLGVNLPKLREVGVNCFNKVRGVDVPSLPSLEKVGANFLYSVGTMGEDVNIDFPKLREVGNFFMKNAQPSVVSLPSLETVGEGFMKGSMRGVTVDLPNLTKAGYEFFGGGFSVQSLNAPKLTDIKGDFMEGNPEIRQQIIEQTGKEFVAIEDVERIDVEDSAYELKDGTVVDAKHVSVKFPEGVTFMVVDTNGNVLAGVFAGKKLAEVVGKQYAAEILKPGSFTIEAKEETRFRKMNEHAEEFNKTHKGGLPVVEINPNNMEAELAEEGFTTEEIDELKKRMKKGAGAFYNPDRNLIYLLDPTLDKERVYSYCWHEDTHVASVSLGVAQELKDEFYSLAQGKKKENLDAFLKALGYEKKDYPEESMAHSVQAMAMLDKWEAGILSKLTGSTAEGAQRQMEIIQPLIDYINNGRQGNQSNLREDVRNGDVYDTASNEASRETEAEGTGETATGGLTEEEINLLTSATGYSREDIVRIFGNGETRFRKAVQDSEEARQEIESLDNEVLATIEELAQELYSNVGVIADIESIPDEKKRRDAKRGMKGWYDPATGMVSVVLPNIADKQDAVETMLHEIVGHRGLRGLLGEKYNEFLNEVFVNAPKEMRADIMKIVMAQKADGSRTPLRTAVEEYLAGIAEGGFVNNPTLWTKIMTALKQLLRSMGVKVDVSENELAYMLWRSYQLLKGGYNIEQRIIDSVMQQRMEVGEYRRRNKAFHGPMRSQGRNLAKEIELFGLRDEYEKMILSTGFQSREAFQDSMFALKKFQEMLEKATGKKLPDYFNAYYMENALSSANQAQAEAYGRLFYKKIVDEINKLKKTFKQEDIFDYLIIKHGIERNREMAVRSVLSSEENGLDRKMYKRYVAKKKEILKNAKENKLSWEETQRELDDLAERFGADLSKDYSGLSAIFSKVKGKGKTER